MFTLQMNGAVPIFLYGNWSLCRLIKFIHNLCPPWPFGSPVRVFSCTTIDSVVPVYKIRLNPL